MSYLFFYLIFGLILAAISWLFVYQRKQTKKFHADVRRQEPRIDFNLPKPTVFSRPADQSNSTINTKPEYDSNLIVLQIQAYPGKLYMGYELLQTLQSVGLSSGEMNIFHRYVDDQNEDNVQFSVAAATLDGLFPINEMGSFKCAGLVMYMRLVTKQKLMTRFDLMLDTARQLVEELGGEIYDDLQQPINAAVIRRLREKICTVETNNLYASDLLDNLD